MLVKIHSSDKRTIVSICDKDLIGKKIEDKDLQIDISGYFYKGKEISEKETLKIIENADSLNIVGEKSIRFAVKNNLVDESQVIKIKNIPHAIIILR